MKTHRKPRVPRLQPGTREAARYEVYSYRWREGVSIPELAEVEGCSPREMSERIASAHGIHRFGEEMKRWKTESNRIRRAAGLLPPVDNRSRKNQRLRPLRRGVTISRVDRDSEENSTAWDCAEMVPGAKQAGKDSGLC